MFFFTDVVSSVPLMLSMVKLSEWFVKRWAKEDEERAREDGAVNT